MADDKKAKAEPRALVPNAEGKVMVEVLMGPYRGQNLTMPAAEGQAAITAHWARDPSEAIYEPEELTEPQRIDAMGAAGDWAKAQWDAAQAERPEETKRNVAADQGGGYNTKTTAAPATKR